MRFFRKPFWLSVGLAGTFSVACLSTEMYSNKLVAMVVSPAKNSNISTTSTHQFRGQHAQLQSHIQMTTVHIVVNGQSLATCDGLVSQDSMYVPMWYIMQTMKTLGVSSTWNGRTLAITTPTGTVVDGSGSSPGTGGAAIAVNGQVIYSVNTIPHVDRSGNQTQFMPLWYVLNVFQRLSIGSDWNGSTLQVNFSKTNSPIKHLVVLYLENHSFDNYFGTYPNDSGFLPLPQTPSVDGIPNGISCLDAKGKMVFPFEFTSDQMQTRDIDHSYEGMIQSFDNGKMDMYLRNVDASREIPIALGHYNYKTIGPYWDYAQHFALADHWFEPIFGPTTPNMLYLVSGQAGTPGHICTYSTVPTNQFLFDYRNIGDEMNGNGISWNWYQGELQNYHYHVMDDPFMFFKNNKRGKYKSHTKDLDDFGKDIRQGKLASVTFLKPDGEDEHPGGDLDKGIHSTTHLINEIMNSPEWNSTAIVVSYDESGGFWDHLAPPDRTNLNVAGMRGDGPRVPTLVISPYAKQNYVSHLEYDSTSILKFIEWNWNLPALGRRDANANNLLDFFTFDTPDFTRFMVDGYEAQTLSGTQPETVFFNNFKYGSTGAPGPVVLNGTVYMAVQDLARNLNVQLQMGQDQATFAWQGHTCTLQLNSSHAVVDQQTVDLGVPIVNSNGYWMIPIRPVAESLGLQVIDNTDGSIQIRT